MRVFKIKFSFYLTPLLFFGLFSGCAFLQSSPPPVFYWPLKTVRLTQHFSLNSPHLGIDLKANKGTPVLSSHTGTVIYAGQKLTGYGKTIIIEGPSGWASLYAHLNSIKVKQGQHLKPKEVIGTVGRTGRSSGPHLHFELMFNKTPLNPLNYLPPL